MAALMTSFLAGLFVAAGKFEEIKLVFDSIQS